MNIEWKVTEQESQQEMVSGDGRWHITKNQKGNQEPSFYLSNYDLLLSPHGSGTDYKQCFESFIADCDAFIEKIKAVRYIREAGGRVAHGVLLKRMHESKEVFKQIIETLEENGTISHELKGSGASMTRFYLLR